MIRQEFIELLRCPETQQTLAVADEALVQSLNAAVERGQLRNRSGEPVQDRIDAALVREDGTIAYLVIDEIPILLQDEAIPLDQVATPSPENH